MPFSDALLDQKRLETDPTAEMLVQEALAENQRAFWQFITDLEGTRVPSWLEPLIEKHLPDYNRPVSPDFEEHFSRSARFFEAHAEAVFLLLGAYSLPYCYAAEAGVQVLFQTQQLSKRPLKRLQETGHFVFNVLESGAFGAGGKGWLSILKVRLMHASVRVKIRQYSPWDTGRWGEPINQEDMIGTLFSFSLIVLLGLRKLGYTVSETEAEAYFQHWNQIGIRLGVQPDLLPKKQTQAFALMKRIERRHMRPSEAGRQLTQILVRETEKSAQGQLPPGFVPAMMRYLLGEKIAGFMGLTENARWADPVIQLSLLRQKHFTPLTKPSPEEISSTYRQTKKRLMTMG